jgi:4-hydroxy-2-oxoheptanedioate aldolase
MPPRELFRMRTNPVKLKLRSGQPSFGTWLSLGDIYASRVLARMGWDWLTLDMEHQPIDWSQAATVFALIAEAGCVPLCRVPEGTHTHIKQALDAGAWGIVAPMVNTAEQARTIVAAAKYPPAGNRSLGGGLHALNFNCTSAEYFAAANDNILVILQTESPQGVDNAEAIYSVPGVDAIFVGPNDLRAQMRITHGEPTDAQFEELISRIIATGKKTGTPTGIHAMTPDAALKRAAEGMQFIAVASELRMMTRTAEEFLRTLKPSGGVQEFVKY